METVKFIEQCLNELHERLVASLRGVVQEQLSWRPSDNANSIGEILFHLIRAEDRSLRRATGLGPEVWESQQWVKRLGLPGDQLPTYQIFKSPASPKPRLEDLLGYLEAVHQDTLDKLRGLSASDLDRVPDPQHPERSISSYLRHSIIHSNNHHGQIDYVRGLIQREWNLPPGTGIVQP